MNSVEAQIVIRRLDRTSRSDLLPFYVPEASSSTIEEAPLLFRDQLADPMVYAEIVIQYGNKILSFYKELMMCLYIYRINYKIKG